MLTSLTPADVVWLIYAAGFIVMATLTVKRTPTPKPYVALAVAFALLWPLLLVVYVFDKVDRFVDPPPR